MDQGWVRLSPLSCFSPSQSIVFRCQYPSPLTLKQILPKNWSQSIIKSRVLVYLNDFGICNAKYAYSWFNPWCCYCHLRWLRKSRKCELCFARATHYNTPRFIENSRKGVMYACQCMWSNQYTLRKFDTHPVHKSSLSVLVNGISSKNKTHFECHINRCTILWKLA